jgi:hypothetical protein
MQKEQKHTIKEQHQLNVVALTINMLRPERYEIFFLCSLLVVEKNIVIVTITIVKTTPRSRPGGIPSPSWGYSSLP